MAYFDPTGREVTYSDAYSGGQLKPGYRSIVGSGERVGFDIAFMDSDGGNRVFLIDGSATANRDAHDRFLEMTGREPIRSRAGVQDAAAQVAREDAERRLLDDARVATAVAMYGRSKAPPVDTAKLEAAKAVRDAALHARF